ncbi:MAG TPA: hypothetical protein VGI03_00705 [Verrucomicrobiae bacterium]|jgi:uncharacterized protein involved in outer membrane biogenesis
MFKFLFKWLFRLILAIVCLVVVAVIVLLLTYNSILRTMMEHNIREQTGMDAEIGQLDIKLTEPVIEIRDLRIYNPTNFAGAPFLNIPEIHIEYDLSALRRKQLHFTLVRLNLAEIDIVKNQEGQLNVLAMNPSVQAELPPAITSSSRPGTAPVPTSPGTVRTTTPTISPGSIAPPTRPSTPNPPAINFQEQTGYDFTGIDKLNLSFGKEKYIDLKNPGDDREQVVGLDNWVIPHVNSMTDLAGTVVLIDLRSNHFFDDIVAKNYPGGNADVLKGMLQSMGL